MHILQWPALLRLYLTCHLQGPNLSPLRPIITPQQISVSLILIHKPRSSGRWQWRRGEEKMVHCRMISAKYHWNFPMVAGGSHHRKLTDVSSYHVPISEMINWGHRETAKKKKRGRNYAYLSSLVQGRHRDFSSWDTSVDHNLCHLDKNFQTLFTLSGMSHSRLGIIICIQSPDWMFTFYFCFW